MSFIIDVPIDSGVFNSGDDGDATAVEPSLLGKCIFADFSRLLAFDAIMMDFLFTSIYMSVHTAVFIKLFHFSSFSLDLNINQCQALIHFVLEILPLS